MKPITTLTVTPALPAKLQPLETLAYNLRWAWTPDTIELFRRIDRDLWETVYHNPVRMLGLLDQTTLEKLTQDPGFMIHLQRASESLRTFLEHETWFQRNHPGVDMRVAYFSAEFGLTECLPIYSGGLGVLSGDHVKSASTLGLPFIGVGLLYQEGYFQQYLNNDGWQQEDYPVNAFYTLPVRPVKDPQGTPLRVTLDYPEGTVIIQVWQAEVGRIPLFLLDTNLEENPPKIREITAQLYGGDDEMRLCQEILLGIGGIRALDALDLRPTVCHMNEGHSVFLGLERIRQVMAEQNLDFDTARELTAAGNVFTTHTPVPAGHDVFPDDLIDRYFKDYIKELNLAPKTFLDLGRAQPGDQGFNLTMLALNLSAFRNGVSRLHGKVSRQMLKSFWPDLPENEIPITSITNGIHVSSWISQNMRELQDSYLGPQRLEAPQDHSVWQRIDDIPPEELWRVHERRRERLVAFARRRFRQQLERQTSSPVELGRADEILDAKALTIGFARRFATYKRATLLFHDLDRFADILCNNDHPVQIIFAGKAHPRDHAGKELIQEIFRITQRENLRRRIVFIENYDMCVARYLVQGVDIWLNTPMRPLEASGTSGMKAMANGALNMSVLDGWWAEAYQVDVGWAIGRGEEYDDPDYQNQVEASAIYQILEKEAIPLFYNRGPDGLPRGWIARMKNTMKTLCPGFNTHRMVQEYTDRFYLPAQKRSVHLASVNNAPARALAEWKGRIEKTWDHIRIDQVEAPSVQALQVGDELKISALVFLGDLAPEDVSVELCHGRIDAGGNIENGQVLPMSRVSSNGDALYSFVGRLPFRSSGRYGYTVRALPYHKDLTAASETGRIIWAQS